MPENNDNQLLTLKYDGKPPESRIGDAIQARSIYQSMWQADEWRAKRRAMVKGLVDGNPPYRQSDLVAAGMAYKCNVNWRQSESYLESAVGAFYDLFNEAPTYAEIKLKKHKNYSEEQLVDWSRIVTENFDWLLRYEDKFDYNIQLSQSEMVLYGAGPMVFDDELSWMPRAILYGQVKVLERTKSDTNYWELCAVEVDYQCDELWQRIKDPESATAMGWNVERVRQAIINAHPEYRDGSALYRSWEWHQQQLKNGSFYYSQTAKIIPVAHMLFREFTKEGEQTGRISHDIIIRDNASNQSDVFLFRKVARYDDWKQCVHPMYYDRGNGGFHHSVTGMGTKMYSAMEFQNRLMCNNADKAFAPKLMFKPTTSTGVDNFALQQHGDYAVLSEGYDAVQAPMAGMMEEGMVFNREITNLLSSNLSQYRTNSAESATGNPDTATEVQFDAAKEAKMQKTQMARYYQQCDGLYSEMYRRACLKETPDARAKEFQKRCKDAGVPDDCLPEVECVKATRVVGQGSEYLRQQSTEKLFGAVLPMLPENGRQNLINDVIAANAGQDAVQRYNPSKNVSKLPDDQYAWAMSQVADMKTGVPAIPTASQNPAVFTSVFIQAADQAAGTLQQGANPQEVLKFLELDGQAAATHLQRLAQDPSRKQLFKQLEGQFKKMAQVTDQLAEQVAQQQQEQQQRMQELQQMQNGDMMEFQLKKQKQDAELMLKMQKTQFGMQEKAAKTKQAMQLKDLETAQSLRHQQQEHALSQISSTSNS